jgi:hypothetical protein
MTIIIHCDKCQKRMGSLEPHMVIDNQYLCKKCGEELTKVKTEEKEVKDFYDGLDIGDLPYVGYWKKPNYRIFIKHGYNFMNTVTIILYPTPSYADQFENSKYIILAYGDRWSVYDQHTNKVMDAIPTIFNNFDAYEDTYMEYIVKQYV